MTAKSEKCVRMVLCAAMGLGMLGAGARAQGPERQPENHQTFYLKNATNRNAANDISTAMRNMMPRAKIYYAETENALLVGGSAEELAQAQKMLADLDRPQKVYRLTYTIGDAHGTPRHVSMLLAAGRRSVAKQGARVPIMTGAYKEGGGEPANTQFQYVDIGLNVEASVEGYGDGMRLQSKIEETSVSEQKSNVGIQDPVIEQSVLEAESALSSGKPVTLGSLEMPEGKRMDVQVSIEVVQ